MGYNFAFIYIKFPDLRFMLKNDMKNDMLQVIIIFLGFFTKISILYIFWKLELKKKIWIVIYVLIFYMVEDKI